MEIVIQDSRAEAWLECLKVLRERGGLIYNLVIEIKQPGKRFPINKIAQDSLDDMLSKSEEQVCNSVADTIFPTWEYVKHGAQGVYSVYPDEVFPAIRSLHANRWGTYAFRLVRRTDEADQPYNPLERVVNKLKQEIKNSNPKRSVYELDAETHALGLYDSEFDWNNYRGGQCLSYISLKLGPSKELYLTAMYRNQFFMRKALGNFLGLARLQEFIAREVGVSSGPLVCHATLANLDTKTNQWGLRDVNGLITKLENSGD